MNELQTGGLRKTHKPLMNIQGLLKAAAIRRWHILTQKVDEGNIRIVPFWTACSWCRSTPVEEHPKSVLTWMETIVIRRWYRAALLQRNKRGDDTGRKVSRIRIPVGNINRRPRLDSGLCQRCKPDLYTNL